MILLFDGSIGDESKWKSFELYIKCKTNANASITKGYKTLVYIEKMIPFVLRDALRCNSNNSHKQRKRIFMLFIMFIQSITFIMTITNNVIN